MKPTQEQVIAWAREAGLLALMYDAFWEKDDWLGQLQAAFTLAYEAGRKDENDACAKVCELIAINAADTRAAECAVGIRARREQ